MEFEHSYLLKHAIAERKAHTYLEIGVYRGDCFMEIKAPRTIAVDPDIQIPEDKMKKAWKKDFP